MQYNLVQQNGRRNLSVFLDEVDDGMTHTLVASEDHPNIEALIDAVTSDSDPQRILDLFDVQSHVASAFEEVSERVAIQNGIILFDGQPVSNTLTRTVLRFYRRGENFMPLVRFFEKIMTNLDSHVRDQLYDWISDRNLTISDDGDFIGYKGVRRSDDGQYYSINTGPAIVNGHPVQGAVANNPGSTVEINRGLVDTRSDIGCSSGLHVGTWDYASTFGRGYVLTTKVNPRDVISVPTDCNAQKMRVCRYQVLEITEQQLEDPVMHLDNDIFLDPCDDPLCDICVPEEATAVELPDLCPRCGGEPDRSLDTRTQITFHCSRCELTLYRDEKFVPNKYNLLELWDWSMRDLPALSQHSDTGPSVSSLVGRVVGEAHSWHAWELRSIDLFLLLLKENFGVRPTEDPDKSLNNQILIIDGQIVENATKIG